MQAKYLTTIRTLLVLHNYLGLLTVYSVYIFTIPSSDVDLVIPLFKRFFSNSLLGKSDLMLCNFEPVFVTSSTKETVLFGASFHSVCKLTRESSKEVRKSFLLY